MCWVASGRVRLRRWHSGRRSGSCRSPPWRSGRCRAGGRRGRRRGRAEHGGGRPDRVHPGGSGVPCSGSSVPGWDRRPWCRGPGRARAGAAGAGTEEALKGVLRDIGDIADGVQAVLAQQRGGLPAHARKFPHGPGPQEGRDRLGESPMTVRRPSGVKAQAMAASPGGQSFEATTGLETRSHTQHPPMETYRSSHRPERHRIQRAIRASEVGDRAHDVMAVRLPQTQSPLRAPARNYLAFLGLAAALCCYKRLVRLTT